jgi:cohesin loading factor subunit SCC2
MNPPAAYPTPPPPGIRSTSSSLAFALGHPLTYTNQSKAPIEHAPKRKEPVAVFNDFVAQKDREITKPPDRDTKGEEPLHSTKLLPQVAPQSNTHLVVQQAIPSPRVHVPPSPHPSTQATPRSIPDPSRLPVPPSPHPSTQATPRSIRDPPRLPVPSLPLDNIVTPKKRKYADEIKGSPLKRMHTLPSQPQDKLHVQFQTTPFSSKATPRHVMAYVELPPLPSAWRTPSKKHSFTPFTSTRPDDFDPLGSEEEDDSQYKLDTYANAKSSARRTGDRDERGGKPAIDVPSFIHVSFSASRKAFFAY